MTPEAIELAAHLCRRFEGFRSRPYLCPAGIPTIGFGTTRYKGGRVVMLSDPPVTLVQAENLLLEDLEWRARRLALPSLSDRKAAAILDFTYNLGFGNFDASTLKRCIDRGDFDAVPEQLRRWVYSRGKITKGLVLRREAEVEYWNEETASR